MATNYSQIRYGSRGEDVKTLQGKLNSNGYNLDVDGNFGPKTQAAVKDYQKKSGLAVDGVVGKDTWGAITGFKPNDEMEVSTMGATGAQNQAPAANMGYVESENVRNAQALLEAYQQNKPGDFNYGRQSELDAIMDQILNREKFSYDLNSDALYKQYAEQFSRMGKMAMMDTMGQAAAMTGGYGNSYAQSVGQQTYQGYLQQLNEAVPELYGMALNRYNMEGEQMLNQYGLLSSERDQEYGTYRDQVSDYYTELQRLTEEARYVSEDEYSKWLDDRNYEYQKERDAVADEQWQTEFDESKRQYDEQMNMAEEQWAWEKAQAERAQKESGKGGSSNTGDSGYDLDHVATMSSEEIVAAMQNYQAVFDDTGLAAFLDDLVATNRITEAMADEWYKLYKTQTDDEPTDTTVYLSDGGKKDPFTRKNFTAD